MNLFLVEFADVADMLAHEGVEVGGDTTVLEVDDRGDWLIEERTHGC